MKRFLAILAALTCAASAQTFRTVTADTNNVIRTNFTMPFGQVTFGGSGTNAVPVAAGGTGATNASDAMVNLLPSYTGNEDKILALNSNATSLIWTTNTGGGTADLTNVTGILDVTNGGTGGTNTESAITGLGILNTNNYSVNLFYSGTNADFAHIVIGAFASAYSTNFGDTAVVIGTSAQGSNGGISIGAYSIAQESIAIGKNANSEGRGVSIGGNALAQGGTIDQMELGGIAIGHDAFSDTNNGVAVGGTAATEGNGVAIGYDADARGGTNGGVAIGFGADVYEGVGIGARASVNNGVAIGLDAVDQNEGVAIGIRANTVNGAAIGIDASSTVGYQIGTGTNNEWMEPTIQFMEAGVVYTNQWSGLANSTALGHAVMAATIATNSPTNTNAPTPDAWIIVVDGTNNYYLPLWQ